MPNAFILFINFAPDQFPLDQDMPLSKAYFINIDGYKVLALPIIEKGFFPSPFQGFWAEVKDCFFLPA